MTEQFQVPPVEQIELDRNYVDGIFNQFNIKEANPARPDPSEAIKGGSRAKTMKLSAQHLNTGLNGGYRHSTKKYKLKLTKAHPKARRSLSKKNLKKVHKFKKGGKRKRKTRKY